MESEDKEYMKLNEIWRACRKVQSTLFRYGFNISAEFCQHDPNKTGLISESLFSSILGKYKNVCGLSGFEIREITDYFRLRDGRVTYLQFCQVVCNEENNRIVNPKRNVATGLEWNDPMHVNVLPCPEECRRLCLILIKIAQATNLPLMPYFQDYELVSKNIGTVTIAHFSRVLHFIKIPLTDDDFLLLLKRYMKDAYLVNYVAFIKHIQNILDYLKERNLTDCASKIIVNFPGRLIDLELSEFPPIQGVVVANKIFTDACNHPKSKSNTDCDLVICIQQHIYKNRVRVREFLEGFDVLNNGTVTKNQFLRGLHNMGVGKFLSQRDFSILCKRYIDPIDTNRVMWRNFEDEIDCVFTIKHLDKMPEVEVCSPPTYIKEMPRVGSMRWEDAKPAVRDICEEAISRIQLRIRNRRLYMHPYFKNFDRLNCGHVRCNQANQVFLTNGILLTPEELFALHKRYGNQLGFNYTTFLTDVDPAEYAVPKLKQPLGLTDECAKLKEGASDNLSEEYVVKLLSTAKRQMVVKSIPLMNFLQDYDHHREGEILELDFRRALDNANIKMSVEEVDTLCKLFRSPKRGCCVLYRDFCKALDEVFIGIESSLGDQEITAIPIINLANLDCVECFLNFDERTQCSQGLMKLARKPDEISNLSAVFKDFDREQCGSIRKSQFLRALTLRDMHFMISSREYEAICKAFGIQRGLQLEVNYREFLRVLNVLFLTGQMKRNY